MSDIVSSGYPWASVRRLTVKVHKEIHVTPKRETASDTENNQANVLFDDTTMNVFGGFYLPSLKRFNKVNLKRQNKWQCRDSYNLNWKETQPSWSLDKQCQ